MILAALPDQGRASSGGREQRDPADQWTLVLSLKGKPLKKKEKRKKSLRIMPFPNILKSKFLFPPLFICGFPPVVRRATNLERGASLAWQPRPPCWHMTAAAAGPPSLPFAACLVNRKESNQQKKKVACVCGRCKTRKNERMRKKKT